MISACRRFGILLLLLVVAAPAFAQVTSGKVIYERRTNLYKKFKGDDVREWLREEDKNKVDVFELFFNDSMSLFRPQESDIREKLSWATDKSTVYQNLSANTRLSIKDVWGEKVYVEDSLWKRQWKLTESHRSIAGYNCRKAIWQANDSTRIYAWYADELIPSAGPESFCGLPGVILGLATEDGGVIYFAKSVEVSVQPAEKLRPVTEKKKVYKTAELKTKLEKDFGKNPWGREMIRNMFGLW